MAEEAKTPGSAIGIAGPGFGVRGQFAPEADHALGIILFAAAGEDSEQAEG